MANTRYRESRTLVRSIHRLPGESPQEFKAKATRLRRHFEQFNSDVGAVCQWLMGLRPGRPKGLPEAAPFWEFFLVLDRAGETTAETDRARRGAFEAALGLATLDDVRLGGHDGSLMASIEAIRARPLTQSAARLVERLATLDPAHRQVLAKSAAEWIVARYLRTHENSEKHRAEWKREKDEWEHAHPELTDTLCVEFNALFKGLNDGLNDEALRKKRPRICEWERLKDLRDNCKFAGERIGKQNHAQHCKKYREFLGTLEGKKQRYFPERATEYIQLLRQRAPTGNDPMADYLRTNPKYKWFKAAWGKYLHAMKLKPETLKEHGKLPHCTRFGDEHECAFNQHTELCTRYRQALGALPHLQAVEPLYREWRRHYLVEPRRPQFQYPSARDLPMPKIFGTGWFEADFQANRLRLRLDDMRPGEFLEFRFKPWPREYSPQPGDTAITSVHINFQGVRPRAGFRFGATHAAGRFDLSQDEIDRLRSQDFPRQAQDQQFLDAARERLLAAFTAGDPRRDLRLLAVDIGASSAFAAVYHGTRREHTVPLKVLKLDKLYASDPRKGQDNKKDKGGGKPAAADPPKEEERLKGLVRDHVGMHLGEWAEAAAALAQKRGPGHATLACHDLRRDTLHIQGMLRDWVRLNTSQIIDLAVEHQVDLIVFESMRGWKAPGYDKPELAQKKRDLAYFNHGKIRRKVTEKAVERGMRTVTVPYFKSSQHCARCGKEQLEKKRWEKNKKAKRFVCEFEGCGQACDADENAAAVIARVFWGEIVLPVEGQDPH